MNKRIILIIFFIILLTGCSCDYNLEITNKGIKEHTEISIPDSAIPKEDDRVTPFINNDQYPFFGKTEKKYKKKVTKKNGITNITLDYKFTHSNFKDSTVYRSCFDKSIFDVNKNDYYLHFYGNFYCLHTKELKINIKTNNIVKKHNADKVSGNTYTWIIDSDNMTYVDIEMEISKEWKYFKYIKYIVLFVFGSAIIFSGYFIYKKFKTRDLVNEI